ncbi:unnamed protein product [Rhodiola kirilowii]
MRGDKVSNQLHNNILRSLENGPFKQKQLTIGNQPRQVSYPLKSPSSEVPLAEIVKWNMKITEHMRNGHCHSALNLFNKMPARTSITYNAMVSGYLSNGKFELARRMFDEIPHRDLHSWNIMISGYIKNNNLGGARALFDQMPHRDVVSWNSMLSGYAHSGYVDEAREIFEKMPSNNTISWNGLLSAYVQNGRLEEARKLFDMKETWDVVSWNCLMSGYMKRKRLQEARWLFDRMPEKDAVSWNTIITGHAQYGELQEAGRLFQECPCKDVFTWTAMVSGYVQNGMLDNARYIFDNMPEKNSVSWNAMIAGYVQSKRMDLALKLFELMPCRNISSWNTMITGYAQSGDIAQARNLFDIMPQRDCISWAAIISSYAQGGYNEEALHQFKELLREGDKPNRSSLACTLSTCSNLAALELGKQVHGRVFKAGLDSGCFVGNALLTMYCKCGDIDDAYNVFREIGDKDVVSWNTLIYGYARHGFGKEALNIFEMMNRGGVQPDAITLVGVLSACSHNGLVDRGTHYFDTMRQKYGIIANSKHYTCMIDLLGRSGRLDEAQSLMKSMPTEPDAAMWGALLGASRIHGNTELGEKAAKIIFEMEPENAGMYVLLSNLYAATGRWADAGKLRVKMRDKGIKKDPGCSWVEAQNKTHTFSVGDCRHPDKDRIYAYLEELDLLARKDGYITKTKLVLHDVEEEEKVHMLKYHSERLAVAFALLSIPAGRPIRIMKNLRVCADCHEAIKHISKIVGRLIIIRDSHRFHHFKDGECSCGDYW